MKKKNEKFIPIILIMIVVFGFILNNNKDFLKDLANNLKVAQIVIFYETGMKFFDILNARTDIVIESNFIPESDDDINDIKSFEIRTENTFLSATNDVNNQTTKTFNTSTLLTNYASTGIELESDDPQILIIHTHGTESYARQIEDDYEETAEARTLDSNYSVTKIARILEENLDASGINTIRSEELHDYPSYTGAYDRSRETIDEYLTKYPSIKMVIDVHRDALVDENGVHFAPTAVISNTSYAQLMLVVGTNEGGLSHDDWPSNLGFALNLQQQINENYDGLMRSINLRTSRFNQDKTPLSMLIEVGSSGNTLKQAENSINAFSKELETYIKNNP